ncbi:ABC transporter ATP-binding protein [Wukongibacter baidiensis]|uniref:ATP-binding cassette domain-containing protein n=1 Tax=Wukongibacter baidiensis TaxID=1723361 RepID=UPI003D7FE849
MKSVLEIKGLEFSYNRNKKVISNLDLTIDPCSVTALVGPNGVGKSTLLKLAAGLLTNYTGSIGIQGYTPGTKNGLSLISYIPDSLFLPKDLTAKLLLDMHSNVFPNFSRDKASEILGQLDVPFDKSIKTFSKGMTAKLQIAIAMSKESAIYLLDEPFGGIDPLARDEVMKMIIKNYSDEGAVLISTHEITDTESLYDRVVFLKNGVIERDEDIEEARMKGLSLKDIYMEVFSK